MPWALGLAVNCLWTDDESEVQGRQFPNRRSKKYQEVPYALLFSPSGVGMTCYKHGCFFNLIQN